MAEPKVKLTDIAYEQIEEAIITLRIPPGSVISELTLSEMLNIGRTPIREAIQRLAREHLLLVLPQRGLLVPDCLLYTSPSPRDQRGSRMPSSA